jgi:hypothetical protein
MDGGVVDGPEVLDKLDILDGGVVNSPEVLIELDALDGGVVNSPEVLDEPDALDELDPNVITLEVTARLKTAVAPTPPLIAPVLEI